MVPVVIMTVMTGAYIHPKNKSTLFNMVGYLLNYLFHP